MVQPLHVQLLVQQEVDIVHPLREAVLQPMNKQQEEDALCHNSRH